MSFDCGYAAKSVNNAEKSFMKFADKRNRISIEFEERGKTRSETDEIKVIAPFKCWRIS